MPPARIDGAHFSPDTRSFLKLLHDHGVRYLIVGGEAVIFHGHVRLTGDVDFFFQADASNASRLFSALGVFWDGEIPSIEEARELTDSGLVLQFGRPPNRIDLINDIEGVTFDEAWAHRVEATLVTGDQEIPILYIGLDDLIRNKRASGRPRDLDDLAYLERASRR